MLYLHHRIAFTKKCSVPAHMWQLRSAIYSFGSTTRFIHDHVREHINNENSSVKKHIHCCQYGIITCIHLILLAIVRTILYSLRESPNKMCMTQAQRWETFKFMHPKSNIIFIDNCLPVMVMVTKLSKISSESIMSVHDLYNFQQK